MSDLCKEEALLIKHFSYLKLPYALSPFSCKLIRITLHGIKIPVIPMPVCRETRSLVGQIEKVGVISLK